MTLTKEEVKARIGKIDEISDSAEAEARRKEIQDQCPHGEYEPFGKYEKVQMFLTCSICGAVLDN